MARRLLRRLHGLDARVVWVEGGCYAPATVSVDDWNVRGALTVTVAGTHARLGAIREAVNASSNGDYRTFDRLEAVIGRSRESQSGMIVANAYMTGNRPHALTVAEDSDLVSLPPNFRRLLHEIVRAVQPERILELGTAHGLSALYIVSALEANGRGHLHTIDGDPVRQRLALEHLRAGFPTGRRVTSHLGRFADVLPSVLPGLDGSLDLVFDDGPHLPEVTLESWRLVAPYLAPGAIVIVDDIHHANGNIHAWRAMTADAAVAAWLEVNGRLGICVRM